MPVIIEVPAISRSALIPLFENHRRDRALIDCVLEGHTGRARVNDASALAVARVDCGPFTALGGDPASTDAEALIRCAPIDWVTPETDGWRAVLERIFAGRIKAIPFVTWSAASLDVAELERRVRGLAHGYELRRVDAPLIDRLVEDLRKEWALENFRSRDDFLRRGVGYVALHDGRVVAGATSAIASSRAIDIDIETAAAHRRKGLATAVGAALALECLVRGLEPLWLASNETSCRLAEKLGYTRGDSYETYEIAPQSAPPVI
ncbi:MAG: GNAT family N-acetyltransferase [Candidatus Bipolaricaulota bacterium]|nr:GNAT family N-acetyltransferase [Candidatus Bipolaricaulota bacterium]